ncbi:hypothetical protein KC734_15740, partial [candidate division KSB1 bacterium]|nr:hypothetical protein [candidate division KSB1 bacterium]
MAYNCFPFHLLAQEDNVRFEHIGREQGLTATSILSILQDHQGFMWFGTEDGLFRFDGYSMTAFKHDPLDSTSLGNDQVFVILEDHTGTLWLGTAGGGLNRFDRTTEQFTRFKHNPNNLNTLSADVISALYEDRKGNLWIGTWEGLNRLNLDSEQIIRFMHDPENPYSMSPFWINYILEDSSGNLWVGTNGGLSRFDQGTGDFTHFFPGLEGVYNPKVNNVGPVFEDGSGILWLGVRGALARFEAEQPHFTHFLKTERIESVYSIHEDSRGAFWIGTNRALYRFSSTHDTQLLHGGEEPFGLEGRAIQDIYEDNTGTIWFATDQGGYRYDPGRYRFMHLINDPNDANSLSQNRVRAMAEDSSGSLWIGLAGEGLNKYDPKTRLFQHSFPGLENKGFSVGPSSRNYTILNLHVDHFGVLWIGQWIGLGRYDPQKRKFQRFVHDPDNSSSLSGNNVQSIYEDRTGTLWVGIYDEESAALNRFDREQERFTRFDLNLENASGLGKGAGGVSSISEGRSGRLWFATYGSGICLFDRESETFSRFTHIPGDPNSLSHGWIGAVHEDRKGILWAAPWYGGLNKLDPESGQVKIYTEKHGLLSNQISSITEDDHGRLWLAAKNGLSRFDPHSETFRNFDRDDGLLNTDFSSNVSLKSKTGHMFFGGENGIDYVHPDSIQDNPYIPPVVFTRFSRFNSGDSNHKAIIERGISKKSRFELSYQDHILTFEFAALNYRNSHKNLYAYKLEGFHDDWIQLGSKHEVTLTNLDPGEYTLRVKGSNNDGVWNEEGASLIINISPPWWQTYWAYAFYFVIALTFLYAVRKYELKRILLRNALEKQSFESRKLKEVDEMKSRFFADISHEFRTPLTLILGPFQKVLGKITDRDMREDLRVMQRNAYRLQGLVDQLLDLSRIEAQRMPLRAQQNDIVPKIKEWVASFASLAESRNIKLNSQFPEHPIVAWFDAEKLEKVVFNLLSNALKFTPDGGEINVQLSINNEQLSIKRTIIDHCLLLTVKDSGIGISPEQ